jgi:hypothetical protein
MGSEEVELTDEEQALILRGIDYRELKNSRGWIRLTRHLTDYRESLLETLRIDHSSTSEQRIHGLIAWQMAERFYEEITTTIESAVSALEEKERELREHGIIHPELGIR